MALLYYGFISCYIYSFILYIFFRIKIFPKSIDCEKMFIFAMLMGKIYRRKKAFCFKSESLNRQIFNRGPKQSMLILCICRLRAFCTSPMYISRRGNIVSSWFILLGRLAMPKIHGRKTTSLTSFLFLYPIVYCHGSEA